MKVYSKLEFVLILHLEEEDTSLDWTDLFLPLARQKLIMFLPGIDSNPDISDNTVLVGMECKNCDISTGAAASVSPHKSNVTKCYQINSRGVSFLIVRDLEVPLDLLEPDLHGLVVKVVHLPPVKAHLNWAVRSLPRLYWGADNLFAWTYTVRSYKSCKGIISIISYYCDNSL